MDLAAVIRARLEQLGIEQRALAVAAEVTESYISQLLSNKKMPPASDRSDIYSKFAKILRLPAQQLAKVADSQRREALKQKVVEPPEALFKEFRQLILRKVVSGKRQQVTNIFDREPFGHFERFITQKLLDVAKCAASEGLADEKMAPQGCQSHPPELRGQHECPFWSFSIRIFPMCPLETACPFSTL